jgi:hypothetical protein
MDNKIMKKTKQSIGLTIKNTICNIKKRSIPIPHQPLAQQSYMWSLR